MPDRKHEEDVSIARNTREALHRIMAQILGYFDERKTTINEIIVVPITIAARMVRTHDALELLLKEHYPTEGAILALTQFELRLDLAYTASDVKHAADWLNHEETKWSILNVKEKVELLFSEPAERTKLMEVYKYLSGIKHGNPLLSELGFPVRAHGKTFSISTGPIPDNVTQDFVEIIFAYSIYQLAWATHVLNVHTARYANVDSDLRADIRSRCISLHPVEEQLLQMFKNFVGARYGHLSLKHWRRNEFS